MIGLDQRANVFTPATVSGRYTVLAKANLACRLLHVNRVPAATASDRDELAARRDLIFDPDYLMPEKCQLDVDGIRWTPQAGTFGAFRDWNGDVIYRRANLIRQQVTSF